MTPGGGRRRDRGLALVTVLWVLVLLSALAASFSSTTRTEALTARNLAETVRAEALADAGIYRAVLALLEADPRALTGEEGAHLWTTADGEVRLSIEDEAGKIDLNEASPALLARLFAAAGVGARDAAALAAAVVDYRDPDSDREAGGAEDNEYRAAGLAHGAKDDAFVLVDELAQVKGMTDAVFAAVESALTVYTHRPEPVAAAAPPLVRATLATARSGMAIGVPSGSAHGRESGRARTTFRPFERSAAAPRTARSDAAPGEGSAPGLGRDSVAASKVFAIHAEARTATGATFVRDAVVALAPTAVPPYRILGWRQGRRRLITDEEAGLTD
jgi:general secretion pathway protein K